MDKIQSLSQTPDRAIRKYQNARPGVLSGTRNVLLNTRADVSSEGNRLTRRTFYFFSSTSGQNALAGISSPRKHPGEQNLCIVPFDSI